MEGLQIWSVAVHPLDGDTILAGTKPPALFRTRNGGEHWQALSIDIAVECAALSLQADGTLTIILEPIGFLRMVRQADQGKPAARLSGRRRLPSASIVAC